MLDEKAINILLSSDLNNEITQSEREQLYFEILYTIKHKIGCTINGHNDFRLDLYKYAQQAFCISDEDHDLLFAQVSEEKPPIILLNVEVIEARGLEAKDANGFSDPYCMLGIIPGSREIIFENSNNNNNYNNYQENDDKILPFQHSSLCKTPTAPNFGLKQENNNLMSNSLSQSHPEQHQHAQQSISQQHHHKSSLIKRFSSFRRSEKTNSLTDKNRSNSNKEKEAVKVSKTGVIRGKLPAKCIKTTDVKRETLNPVWMEKFKL